MKERSPATGRERSSLRMRRVRSQSVQPRHLDIGRDQCRSRRRAGRATPRRPLHPARQDLISHRFDQPLDLAAEEIGILRHQDRGCRMARGRRNAAVSPPIGVHGRDSRDAPFGQFVKSEHEVVARAITADPATPFCRSVTRRCRRWSPACPGVRPPAGPVAAPSWRTR